MRIYFSGGAGVAENPEVLIAGRKPYIMLSFHGMQDSVTRQRFKEYRRTKRYAEVSFEQAIWQRINQIRARTTANMCIEPQSCPRRNDQGMVYGGMFMDSGAHTLFNKHVKRCKPDYSFFSLKPGTEFRSYCDHFGQWLRKLRAAGDDMLVANVDVIRNPELTWEVQHYLEEEHGVQPVPVVHFGTSMRWVERYLSTGKYDLLGVGGLGQGAGRRAYTRWADELFKMICPASNKFLPLVKTHGFAMTSWNLLCRWPWWSVDSATWVKQPGYGWINVPRWSSKKKGWDYEKPPMQVNFSWRSPQQKQRDAHFTTLTPLVKEKVRKWVEEIGLKVGFDDARRSLFANREDTTNEAKPFSLRWNFRARFIANLHYFKNLEESRPKWPHPLTDRVARQSIRPSFGLC